MSVYGYHRTSTKEQHLDRGIHEITVYCSQRDIPLKKIFTDQHTGKNFERPRYMVLKEDILQEGDELIITEMDRLGRMKNEILRELQDLKEKGVIVRILELPTTLLDFSDWGDTLSKLMMQTVNNMIIEIFAALAQAEMEKKEKRQREGIEQMKARGEWERYGRPPAADKEAFFREYKRVLSGEVTRKEVLSQLNISPTTYYRYAKLFQEDQDT